MALFSPAELDRIAELNAVDKQKQAGTYQYGSSSGSSKPSNSSGSSSSSSGSSPSYGSSYSSSGTSSSSAPSNVSYNTPKTGANIPGLGSMYQNVPGTDWYSTNPSNPNAAKYDSQGRPVASIGFDYKATGGPTFSGYGSQEQFNNILNYNNSGNYAGLQNYLTSQLANNGLISNQSVYGNQSNQGTISPNVPMNATTSAAATPFQTGNTSPLSSSQQSATDWINNPNSGQGGIANYVKTQIDRYKQAVQSGNTSLISALQADANRVGYSLPSSTYTTSGAGQTGAGTTTTPNVVGGMPTGGNAAEAALRKQIEDQIKARNDAQILAINQGLASANQANQLGLTQNQNLLNEGLGQINQQENVNRQALQDINNRRGGLYSGGTDYSLGNLASSSNEARSSLQRDISARIADIQGRNTLNAQQAAERIAAINQAAPAEIQQLVQQSLAAQAEARAKERQQNLENAIKVAGVTGYFQDPQVQEVQQQMAANSQAWFNASDAEKQRLAAENQQLGSSIGAWQDAAGDWYAPEPAPTLARQKQEYDQVYEKYRDDIADVKDQAKFERDTQQWNLEYALDQAYKSGQLSIQARNAALAEAREARTAAQGERSLALSEARENRLSRESEAKPAKIDAKDSAEAYDVILEDLNTSGVDKATARSLVQANRGGLTDSDYKNLLEYINENF